MQALLIRSLSRPPRSIVSERQKTPATGAKLVAQSMLWMLRRRARRHDGRKFTA